MTKPLFEPLLPIELPSEELNRILDSLRADGYKDVADALESHIAWLEDTMTDMQYELNDLIDDQMDWLEYEPGYGANNALFAALQGCEGGSQPYKVAPIKNLMVLRKETE